VVVAVRVRFLVAGDVILAGVALCAVVDAGCVGSVLPGMAGLVRVARADARSLGLLPTDATPTTTSTANAQMIQFAHARDVGCVTIDQNTRATARGNWDIGTLPPSHDQATAANVAGPKVTRCVSQ
jgi:hypothetical protein